MDWLEQLLLPFGDLVGVQFKLLAQFGHGLVLAQTEFVNDFETPECINLVCNRVDFY